MFKKLTFVATLLAGIGSIAVSFMDMVSDRAAKKADKNEDTEQTADETTGEEEES